MYISAPNVSKTDPLSLLAGAIAVIHQLLWIHTAFASENDKAHAVVADAIGNLHVYVDTLNNESNSTMFFFQGTMPPASRSCRSLL